VKITWPASDALLPIDLRPDADDSTMRRRLVELLNETEAAAAWLILDSGQPLGWLAAPTTSLHGRTAGDARAALRVAEPIEPVDERMIDTYSGRALRLVQRHALGVSTAEHSGSDLLTVHASWSWQVGEHLVVLSTSSVEQALVQLLIQRVDVLAEKIVLDV